MNPNLQAVLSHLDQLAAKLGIAANYVWGFYVHQAYVEAITDGIIAFVFAIVLFTGLYFTVKLVRAGQADKYDGENYYVGAVFSGLGTVLSLSGTVCFLVSAISEVLNPQYWAFHQILLNLNGKI